MNLAEGGVAGWPVAPNFSFRRVSLYGPRAPILVSFWSTGGGGRGGGGRGGNGQVERN